VPDCGEVRPPSSIVKTNSAMKKRIDGRTTKGLRIRHQVHEQILSACIDLIRGGVPAPTAAEIAKRAHLSLRVIFKHFTDLRALRLAAFARVQVLSGESLAPEVPRSGSAAKRLEIFLDKQLSRLEYVTPFHLTAAMVESIDHDVASAMRRARDLALHDLGEHLEPSLKALSSAEKHDLLMRLHVVCSWNSWNFLRTHYRLSPERACAVISDLAQTVLADGLRRARSR
jgi:AcrR family transcriptional regulator